MFIADKKNHIIHDMSFIRFECKMKEVPDENRKKLFSLQTVKRMCDTDHTPTYNGCKYCVSEYHTFDFTKIFR